MCSFHSIFQHASQAMVEESFWTFCKSKHHLTELKTESRKPFKQIHGVSSLSSQLLLVRLTYTVNTLIMGNWCRYISNLTLLLPFLLSSLSPDSFPILSDNQLFDSLTLCYFFSLNFIHFYSNLYNFFPSISFRFGLFLSFQGFEIHHQVIYLRLLYFYVCIYSYNFSSQKCSHCVPQVSVYCASI